jgi:Glyoxalase-like domain
VKNRLHLDVNAGGPSGTPWPDRRMRVDEAVRRLSSSGATFVVANTHHGEYCVTMLEPEGNEFDVQ